MTRYADDVDTLWPGSRVLLGEHERPRNASGAGS